MSRTFVPWPWAEYLTNKLKMIWEVLSLSLFKLVKASLNIDKYNIHTYVWKQRSKAHINNLEYTIYLCFAHCIVNWNSFYGNWHVSRNFNNDKLFFFYKRREINERRENRVGQRRLDIRNTTRTTDAMPVFEELMG